MLCYEKDRGITLWTFRSRINTSDFSDYFSNPSLFSSKKDLNYRSTRARKPNKNKLIKRAYLNQLAINMKYKGFFRTIHPYVVNEKYCVGFCTTKNDLRTFRIDRMQTVSVKEKFQLDSNLLQRATEQIDNVQYFYRKY